MCHKGWHGPGVPHHVAFTPCKARPHPATQCQARSSPRRKMAQAGGMPLAAASDPLAKQERTISSLRSWLAGSLRDRTALLPAHPQDVDSSCAHLDFFLVLIGKPCGIQRSTQLCP
ncbi:hypothetical protein H8959_002499 [Pygathrix nigripes]